MFKVKSDSIKKKLFIFLSCHSLDFNFVAETWIHPKIVDSGVLPLNCFFSIIVRRGRSVGEDGGVLILAEKEPIFDYSDLTLKIVQINDFAVAISIISIQNSQMFLLIHNPP